jgi:hypothetical protein
MGQVTGIWGLLGRCLGLTLMRETQFMGEIPRIALRAEEQRYLETGQRDPQRQSDRREKLTETDACSPASVAPPWCPPSREGRWYGGVTHRNGAGKSPKTETNLPDRKPFGHPVPR